MGGTPAFMSFTSSLALHSPLALLCGFALALITVVVALRRQPAVPALTHVLVAIGILLLTLAAGGLTWRRPAGDVVVRVDLSPSTRTAQFRNAPALHERMRQLLGDVPYRLEYFANGPAAGPQAEGLDQAGALPELPAERTVYDPPTAAAVVLFSDGRFDLPAFGPPTFAVIDPALDSAADAAVERLRIGDAEITVTVRNAGAPRELSLSGGRGPPSVTAPSGSVVLSRPLASVQAGGPVSARLAPRDAWPENDAL